MAAGACGLGHRGMRIMYLAMWGCSWCCVAITAFSLARTKPDLLVDVLHSLGRL